MGDGEVDQQQQRQEYLKAKYPGSFFPLGQYKDRPDYFKRKRKREDSPNEIKLRKKLKRRGLPPSYLGLLLRLHLKPRALEARLHEIADLRDRRDQIRRTAAAEVKAVTSTINQLLGKSKNHEPITTTDINARKSPDADRPPGSVHPTPSLLSDLREPPGSVPDPRPGSDLFNLLRPSSSDRSGSCPGEEDTQDPLVHSAR